MIMGRSPWRAGRRVAALVCAAVSLLGFVAAAAPGQQEGRGARTVRVALPGYENNLTPFTLTFGSLPNTHDMINLVYDPLFWSQVSQDPEPWLAEKAVPSRGARTWTVTLRPNLQWHDGRPLTARDVKFSFDYYRKNAEASGRYAHHVGDVPPFDRAEVVNQRTVRLHYRQPAPTFKILPAADLPIIPEHVWKDVDDPKTAAKQKPVGSGPYKLVEIVPDQRYRFVANERYFKGKPLVRELEMPIVQDPNAAFQALQTGQVDLVARNVPPELVGRLQQGDETKVLEGTRFESTQIYFNGRKPPLTDPRLRKAISLGVDSEALVDRVLQDRGQVGNDSFLHPEVPWAVNRRHQHDPDQAKRLLDSAGYRDRDGDGVREDRRGQPLRFSVLVSSFDPQELRAVQLAARQVRPIGVVLDPDALDPATLRQRREPPREGAPPTFDAYVSGLETHAHVDPDGLYYFFHSPGPKGFGAAITGWSNRRFDQLAERATSLTVEQRRPLLEQMQEIIAREAPVIVPWYRESAVAYRPSAYGGWIWDKGQGPLTKRSFLPAYARGDALSDGGGGGDGLGAGWIVLIAAAVLLVVGGAAVAVRRRRPPAEEERYG